MGMLFGKGNPGGNGVAVRKAYGASSGASRAHKSEKKSGSSFQAKKRLQYNFKQISAQILRAKKPGSEGQAVIKARVKIASLRRKLGSEDYDDTELAHAIIHAERILRVAKKRKRHLEEEENIERNSEEENRLEDSFGEEGISVGADDELPEEEMALSKDEILDMIREIQDQMQELMRDLESSGALGDLTDEMLWMDYESMKPEDLEQLKKKHRSEEIRDIMEADMKYLKALFSRLAKEKQEASSGGGPSRSDSGSSAAQPYSGGSVSLELGGTQLPVDAVDVALAAEGGAVDASV